MLYLSTIFPRLCFQRSLYIESENSSIDIWMQMEPGNHFRRVYHKASLWAGRSARTPEKRREGHRNKILTKDYGLKPQQRFSTDKFMTVLWTMLAITVENAHLIRFLERSSNTHLQYEYTHLHSLCACDGHPLEEQPDVCPTCLGWQLCTKSTPLLRAAVGVNVRGIKNGLAKKGDFKGSFVSPLMPNRH